MQAATMTMDCTVEGICDTSYKLQTVFRKTDTRRKRKMLSLG